MTPIDYIFFTNKNSFLFIKETNRYTITPPPLTSVNTGKTLYFNDNNLLLSGNRLDMRRIHITCRKISIPINPLLSEREIFLIASSYKLKKSNILN